MIASSKTGTKIENQFVIEMVNIVKNFSGVTANDNISLKIRKGEIHALLGENGAGKTTLMNILYGLYTPDDEKSKIFINGNETLIKNPIDAMSNGIGMVHQHFMLVPIMTVAENVILGSEPTFNRTKLDTFKIRETVLNISRQYSLDIEPDAYIENLPVGLQQRVEIIKILYRGAEILILDEPTAVLIPQEVEELFKTLEALREQGNTIILITHKLREPMIIADRITVLRDGKVIGTVKRTETSPEQLAEMMIGRKLVKLKKTPGKLGKVLLKVQDIFVENDKEQMAVKGITLNIKEGEILGVAGVVGNGQKELAEAITGLRKIKSGTILLKNIETTKFNAKRIYDLGLAYIPEDRNKFGSVGEFTISENLILGIHHHKDWYYSNNLLSKFFNWKRVHSKSKERVQQFDIRTPSILTNIHSLSGGNVQKVIVAREISKNPVVIIAAQPTRGLDVGVIEYVHRRIIELRDSGKAVLLISSELDEILTLSDRIAVIFEGQIISFEDPMETNELKLGLLMAGHKETKTK
ncbi:MAG: ABC transporter ATP-binding protein [Candidatus Hodarchaeales archaeon]|jgi:simple sugar transport system ATP-binding protein